MDVVLDSDAPQRPDGGGPGEEHRGLLRRPLVLGVLVVAAGAGIAAAITLGPSYLRILDQKDATLATPERAAGLTLDDTEPARGTADYLRTALAADLGLDNTVGGVYTDPDAPSRSVIFVGGTTLLRSPEKDLDRALSLLSDEASAVTGVRSFPSGELGGVLKCGTTTADGSALTVCGWADHGSIALVLFPDRSIDDSASLLRDMRIEIQHRD